MNPDNQPVLSQMFEWDDDSSYVPKMIKNIMDNFEEELAEMHTDQLSKAIDDEIISQILCEVASKEGWHKVVIDNDASVCPDWINVNIKHTYRNFAHTWYFESEADSVVFSLTWM